MLPVRGTDQAKNIPRGVFRHNYGGLCHMMAFQAFQLPPHDFQRAALQGGVQRRAHLPRPSCVHQGGCYMGSRRLPPFFHSGAEQGFLQGPVHHVRREHAFLLQTPQNAVPPFQRTFRMPEGVQEGRPLRQPRQQGAFRQGQAGHLPAKVETRRRGGPRRRLP